MRDMGLIRGASPENTIILGAKGPENGPLRFADEYVRHKVLDLIGDLALAGRRIEGHVVAERAGHAMHTALVSRLLKDRSAWELAHVPVVAAPTGEIAAATLPSESCFHPRADRRIDPRSPPRSKSLTCLNKAPVRRFRHRLPKKRQPCPKSIIDPNMKITLGYLGRRYWVPPLRHEKKDDRGCFDVSPGCRFPG